MGGCFSTFSKKHSNPAAFAPPRRSFAAPVDPPLPEPDAEETVKEVLSETPRPPHPRPPPARDRTDLVPDPKELELVDNALPLPAVFPLPPDGGGCCDARSEDASEAWSVSAKSEALSASAAPAEKRRAPSAGRRDERSPAKHQRKRSVSGELACRRDRSVSVGCVSGRSSPSPAARRPEHAAAVARTNSAREAARSRAAAAAKRDPGERSGRRSVSPATKRAAELRHGGGQKCRAPPAAKSREQPKQRDPTAARQHPKHPGSGVAKAAEPEDEGGKPSAEQPEGGGAASDGESKESLENPLVSLECFIFL